MKSTSTRGFTLVEVLCALVILTSAIILIAQGFSTGIRGTELAQRATLAQMLAGDVIGRLEAGEIPVNKDADGDFGEDFPGYAWSMTSLTEGLPGLYQVVLRVTWTDRGEPRELVVARLINEREQTSRSAGKKQESEQK
ncbi:MAG: type II secretion system protein [Planctomycetes bacterium]|nr:type II secretion system protein [Planctomycetota bacterium]